jgi:hypothetical protein
MQLDRKRTFRGLPLAQEIWRYNAGNFFTPVLEDLSSAQGTSTRLKDALDRLDAKKLVRDCPLQKESIHPIQGDVLTNLVRDTEEVINLMHLAYDILSINPHIAESRRGLARSNNAFEIELRRLAGLGSLSTWAVERFLEQHFA